MTRTKNFVYIICCVIMGCLVSPLQVQAAYLFASSDMNIYDLQYVSGGTVQWTTEAYGTVLAYAHDDLGSASDYKDILSNDGSIQAIAATTAVYSNAIYTVAGGFTTLNSTHSDLYLNPPPPPYQADGDAQSDYDNYFTITGGIPGDPVDVTFIRLFSGQLTGETDCGFWSVALAGLMKLEDLSGNVLDSDLMYDIHSGTGSFHRDYAGALVVSATLKYGDEYWIYSQADSEIYGTVPEPGTFALLFAGCGMLFWKVRQRR